MPMAACVDEGIAHQADDAVRGQHARHRIGVACRFGAFHIVHVIDAERYRGYTICASGTNYQRGRLPG
jgi:hypothetical protein